MRGAGLGPAMAFLYSGPAINVLAIVLTARILGWKLGLARAVGAVVLSVIVGLLMHLIYLQGGAAEGLDAEGFALADETPARPLWKNAVYFRRDGGDPGLRQLGQAGPRRGHDHVGRRGRGHARLR